MAASGPPGGEDLIVGRIRRPHGVKGELLIAVDSDRPGRVFRPGSKLQLGDAGGRRRGRELVVERFRPTNDGAILKLLGIGSRDDAEDFRGQSLLIPAAEAAPAAADEVHYRDLIGLDAVADGTRIGKVEDLLEVASGVTLVVLTEQGKETLVPFVKAMVAEVDLDSRTIVLTLPDGLLEL